MLSNIKKVVFIGFLLIYSACNTSKQIGVKKDIVDLSKEGFSIGVITHQKDSKCTYIITDVESQIQYDPIYFTKADFNKLKKTDAKIYFKFIRLKQLNRCGMASPIKIIKIIPFE